MKFPITDFFNKFNKIGRKLLIWLNLLKTFLMNNLILCSVMSG